MKKTLDNIATTGALVLATLSGSCAKNQLSSISEVNSVLFIDYVDNQRIEIIRQESKEENTYLIDVYDKNGTKRITLRSKELPDGSIITNDSWIELKNNYIITLSGEKYN